MRGELLKAEEIERIHLNETLGVPSARVMEKLFAAIDAQEADARRRQRRRIKPKAVASDSLRLEQ